MAKDHPEKRDPREARIVELIDRVQREQATDAEREELALYVEETPALEQRMAERQREVELGGAWLVRVQADRALEAAETTPAVRAERALGVGLTVAGFALSPIAPALSVAGLLGGIGLLTWSFVRVRLRTYKDDPYKDIDK